MIHNQNLYQNLYTNQIYLVVKKLVNHFYGLFYVHLDYNLIFKKFDIKILMLI